MMRFKSSSVVCALGMFTLCGCVTSPQTTNTVSSAYAVGDRAQITLDEVVVSLPLRGASTPYQNLHVDLAAIVNPQKTTRYDPTTVQQIVRRLEVRISSRLVEALSSIKEITIVDQPRLRSQIANEAQALVDAALQRWEHGSEYRVEVVVVGLYWTDASVGKAARQRNWGWE